MTKDQHQMKNYQQVQYVRNYDMSYLPYIWITLHYTSLNAGTLSLYSSVRLYSYTFPYCDILLWHYKWNASTVLLSGGSRVVNQLNTKYSSLYTTCNKVSVNNVEVLHTSISISRYRICFTVRSLHGTRATYD